MVTTKTGSKPAAQAAAAPQVKATAKPDSKGSAIVKFEAAAETLDPSLNSDRPVELPYCLPVGRHERGGLFVPQEELVKAGWFDLSPDDLEDWTITEEPVTGLWLNEVNLCVLATSPTYIFSKAGDDERPELLKAVPQGEYADYDPETQKILVVLLVMFLDDDNQPLHKLPLRLKAKGTFWWNLKQALQDFYFGLETTWTELTGQPFSPKNDKWRSLGVFRGEIGSRMVGKEKGKKSYASCVTSYEKPTPENFIDLYLGRKGNEELMGTIWQTFGVAQKSLPPEDTDSAKALLAAEPELLTDGEERPLRSAAVDEAEDEIPY